MKYEITKEFTSKDSKIGIWVNPLTKVGYRLKPIEFPQLNCNCEVPRTLLTKQLVIRA